MGILSRDEAAFANFCCLSCCRAGDLGDHGYCVDCNTNSACASGGSGDYFDYTSISTGFTKEPVSYVTEKTAKVKEKKSASKTDKPAIKPVKGEK